MALYSRIERPWCEINVQTATRACAGVIHHSDLGGQYTRLAFGERCR